MNRTVGLVILILGICVLVYGFSAADSVSSDVSRLFNGAPTNKSIVMLVLGAILTVFGITSMNRKA